MEKVLSQTTSMLQGPHLPYLSSWPSPVSTFLNILRAVLLMSGLGLAVTLVSLVLALEVVPCEVLLGRKNRLNLLLLLFSCSMAYIEALQLSNLNLQAICTWQHCSLRFAHACAVVDIEIFSHALQDAVSMGLLLFSVISR